MVETDAALRRIASGRFRPTTPYDLSFAITSGVARRQRDLITEVAAKLPGLEQHVMDSRLTQPEALLERMFLIRHELITTRTMAAQCCDVWARCRGTGPGHRRGGQGPRCATSPTSSTGCARSRTASRSSCSA